jgi:hypothetical protein
MPSLVILACLPKFLKKQINDNQSSYTNIIAVVIYSTGNKLGQNLLKTSPKANIEEPSVLYQTSVLKV